MTDAIKKISTRLKAARKAAGFRSATAFAKEKEIPMSTYSQHENGKRSINSEILIFYCKQFGVQPGWLLSGIGSPFAPDVEEVDRKGQLISDALDEEVSLADLKVPNDQLEPITQNISNVDMHLYKEVLVRLLHLYSEENVQISEKELIEFSIEVYNGVVNTTASLVDKISMIDLSINSLRRGVVKQAASAEEMEKERQKTA